MPLMKTRTEVQPEVVRRRDAGNEAAIVFIHGFGGDVLRTGDFPALLGRTPELANWDISTIGCPTNLMLDTQGIWSS
jgi:hypothetical protein